MPINPHIKRGPASHTSSNPRENRVSGRRKFSNPVKEWFAKREAEKKAMEDQAAQKVTNKIEDNAQKLVKELKTVDFLHCDLPQYVLNDRRGETDYPQMCSLEYDTNYIIQLIEDDRQTITMDILPIDKQLMALVMRFQQYVAQGDVTAAKTARDAILLGVREIRCKLPVNIPEQVEPFIKGHAEYLEKWVTLVDLAQRYDRVGNALSNQKAATQDARDRKAYQVAGIASRIKDPKEPDFAAAYFKIKDGKLSPDRSTWSDKEREVHTLMVNAKLMDFTINLHNRKTTSLENDMNRLMGQMDNIRAFLNEMPDFSDPNLLNKYNDIMDQLIEDFVASDQRMEETLNTVERITAALRQVDESRGNLLAMEAATLEAQKVLDEILKENQTISADEHSRLLEQHGLKTPEKIKEKERIIV